MAFRNGTCADWFFWFHLCCCRNAAKKRVTEPKMNRVYKDLLFNLAKRAVQDANSISGLLHSGLKGQLRELFVRELLIPTMPREYVVGSGNILSAYEDISPQLDVVICDGRILP